LPRFMFKLPFLRWKVRLRKLFFPQKDNNKKPQKKTLNKILRLFLALASLLFISFIYPLELMYQPPQLPQEGEIAKEEIIAPFTFPILKDSEELEKDKKLALSNLSIILKRKKNITDSAFNSVELFFSKLDSLNKNTKSIAQRKEKLTLVFPFLSGEIIRLLADEKSFERLKSNCLQILSKIYKIGVVSDFQNRSFDNLNSILILDGNKEILITTKDKILTLSKAKEERLLSLAWRSFKNDGLYAKTAYEILSNFLAPNLELDLEETNKRKEELLASIPEHKGLVLKGEKIVEKDQKVTRSELEKLSSLASSKVKWSFEDNRWEFVLLILGRMVFVFSIILILVIFLYLFKRDVLFDSSKLLMITILILSGVFLAYLIGFKWQLSEYLVPVALTSLLLTILLGVEVGLIATFTLSILLGMMHNFNFNFTLISLVAGSVGAYSVKEVSHRYKFYRPMLYVCFVYVVMIFLMESLKFSPTSKVIEYCGYGIFNGFISTVLTMGLLPLFESLFNITTDITLLELSDLNNPLLKRLALVAPGTYHHSIVVGNLAEAAAKDLGANTLLARVSAYYHDIGKMEKPEYFVENQMGFKSKHKKLSPSMSALILESHVKEGAEMAKKAKLPKKIIDIIKEHHGTTVMSYFYNKALEQGASEEVKDEYRYPGPKPRSKEAGILMLADAVEAASRTLEDPKASRIKGVIKKIIMDKLELGELDECDLTLKDLHAIEESFVPILIGVFHPRVDYPQLVEEK